MHPVKFLLPSKCFPSRKSECLLSGNTFGIIYRISENKLRRVQEAVVINLSKF